MLTCPPACGNESGPELLAEAAQVHLVLHFDEFGFSTVPVDEEVRGVPSRPRLVLELDGHGLRCDPRYCIRESDQRDEIAFERTLVLGETGCLRLETGDVRTPTERNAPHKLTLAMS